MNKQKLGGHNNANSHEGGAQNDDQAWDRAPIDWRMIVVIALMIVGMFIYILSDDLASLPRNDYQDNKMGM